jgi:ABC-type sugar transport system permease subunit
MDRASVLARARFALALFAIGVIALGVRLLAANVLPIDFDEDDYLRAGQQYATGFQAGDPGVLLRENYRTEHPELSKIVTGLVIAPLAPAREIPDRPTTAPPARSLPPPLLAAARTAQAVFGALAALALAVVAPIGGLLLAVHTWSIKYTSQVMLEAVPAFFALLAVMAWSASTRAAAGSRVRRGWMVAAAVAFGLACAGKYLYGVAGLAIVADWLWRSRPDRIRDLGNAIRWLRGPLGWIVLSFVVFFAADPYLWPDPVGRLWASLAYHAGYASSTAVQETGWPSWQPLVWLMGSVPFHEEGTFVLTLDLPITVLALIGLRRLWEGQRVFALWLGIAFVFLVAWPTKWPQYLLILSAPLSLSAGFGARMVLEPIGRWLRRVAGGWRDRATWRARGTGIRRDLTDLRRAAPWVAPALVGFAVLAVIPLLYETAIAVTDMKLPSLRDGLQGGILREAIGGITGQIQAIPYDLDRGSKQVHYVGADLINGFQRGFWFGDQTSAEFGAFSIVWMVLSVGLQAALGIIVAVVLERPGVRFVRAWRTLFILPWAIPEVVGAVAWRDVFHPAQGLLAQFLGGEVSWRDSPELSLLVLLVAATWMGWPLWMLVATAGLRTIPRSVDEAAELDGAGRWQRFRGITLPLLMPLLGAAFIVRGISAFNQFYLFYVIGPPDSTTTLATFSFFVFDATGGPGLYSVSAAVNIVTLVALAAVVVWFLRWRSRAERVAFV